MKESNLLARAAQAAVSALNRCTPLPQVRLGAPVATRLKLLSMLLWTGCAFGCPMVIVFGANTLAFVSLGVFMLGVTGHAMDYIQSRLKIVSQPLQLAMITGPAGLIAGWLVSTATPMGSVLIAAITCGAVTNLMRRSMETNPAMRELLLRANR